MPAWFSIGLTKRVDTLIDLFALVLVRTSISSMFTSEPASKGNASVASHGCLSTERAYQRENPLPVAKEPDCSALHSLSVLSTSLVQLLSPLHRCQYDSGVTDHLGLIP